MSFWAIYMGLYGGGTASTDATAGAYCRTVSTATDTDNSASATSTQNSVTVSCG